jgi:hypothetical protein
LTTLDIESNKQLTDISNNIFSSLTTLTLNDYNLTNFANNQFGALQKLTLSNSFIPATLDIAA